MKQEIQRIPVDPLALGLYVFLVMLSGLAFKAADWADHLDLVAAVGVLGAFAGIALARSIFSGRVAFLFSAVYGLFIVGWEIGGTLDQALTWQDKIFGIFGRLGAFFSVMGEGEVNEDPLIFVLFIALVFWVIGSFGSWWIFRRKGFWAALLPPGIAIFLNQIFYVGRTNLDGYLIFYVLVVLFLAARLVLWRQQLEWREMRAHVPENVTFFISRAGAILALVLVVVSWGGPAFAESEQAAELWGSIARPFAKIQDRIGDILGGLRTAAVVTADYYGDVLPLKAGVVPEDVLIMHVTPDRMPDESGRFYWLARVYNFYDNGNWLLTIGETTEFDPEEGELQLPKYSGRETRKLTFAPKLPAIHRLNVASQPIWVNRSSDVEALILQDGFIDPLTITSKTAIFNGESYEAHASVAVPTANELREAVEIYPDWVVENYLQVPENISERTRELAFRIAEGHETTYDKVNAVTAWLRRNIRYSRETEPSPEGIERIDWFLFDYQVGFCNWYASAEVLMLRILGIPARIAVGFARGVYQSEGAYFEVRGDDAHAWPEVYFSGYGWVEFEPTVSQPVLIRAEPETDSDSNSETGRDPLENLDPGFFDRNQEMEFFDDLPFDEGIDDFPFDSRNQIYLIIILVLLGILAAVVLWFYFDPLSRAAAITTLLAGLQTIGVKPPPQLIEISLQDLTSTGRIYARWCTWLRRLNLPLSSTQTPNERAQVFGGIYPEAADSGWTIVKAYGAERFGGLSSDEGTVQEVWRDLRPFLWLEWLKLKIDPFLHGRKRSRIDPSPVLSSTP
jgi:transglutaminase-like putative cysteine protease